MVPYLLLGSVDVHPDEFLHVGYHLVDALDEPQSHVCRYLVVPTATCV